MGRGRVEEARAVADRYLGGDDYFREEDLEHEHRDEASAGGLKRLFAPGMRGRTLFVCTFYACNVAPYFAIFTFAPQVFAALQINIEAASTISAIGVGPCMVIAAVICLNGGTVSRLMAPETTGLSLGRTTGLRPATA